MKVKDIVEFDISYLNEDGRGVGHLGSQKLVIPDVIEGERVSAVITSFYDGVTFAKLLKVIKPSEFRVKPKCPYNDICGGCNFQHIDYQKQLYIKHDLVKYALSDFNVKIDDTVGVYYPFKYRNKLHFVIGQKDKKPLIGFFKGGTKQIVDIPKCILHDDWAEKLYNIVAEYIKVSKISIYDIDSQEGALRYVTARHIDNNIIVTMVITNNFLPKSEWLYKTLKEEFKKVSLYLNINNRMDSKVYSEDFIKLNGDWNLQAKIMGVDIEVSPSSFLQVNLPIMNKIYKRIIDYTDAKEGSYIIDLFSGIGITSLFFAKAGAKVTSIELEKNSVNEARRLIKANNLSDKVNALQGDCNQMLKIVIDELPKNAPKNNIC